MRLALAQLRSGDDRERNLERVLVTVASELEVAPVVWARSLLVSEAALPLVEGKAS